MTKLYKYLSIDESGKVSYKHPSQLFILSGVVIPEKLKDKLGNKMIKLKKKYFRSEEIVFHSRDMARKKGIFAILEDKKVELNFWSEFISIVNNPDLSFFFIITNKDKAKKNRWQPKTILEKSYLKLLEKFAEQLKINSGNGRIIVESDPSQDLYLIHAHNHLQSLGIIEKDILPREYRKMITSLSLVNKDNDDIDVQIADALAPIAGFKYQIDNSSKHMNLSKVELMKKRLIERKLKEKQSPSFFEVLV